MIDTITPKVGAKAVSDLRKRAEPVWDAEQFPFSWREVWAYSKKRAARDNITIGLSDSDLDGGCVNTRQLDRHLLTGLRSAKH